MGRWAVLCAIGLVAMAMTGCAYEKMLDASQPGPPPWVDRMPTDTADYKMFVGSSLADNVLDDRTARDRAMEDVRSQIAQSLQSTVVREAVDIVKERGAAHLGEDRDDASYYAEARAQARLEMSGVEPVEYYWQRWKVRDGLFSAPYTKRKYYVLARMPKADYDRIQRIVSERIADRMAAGQ